MKYVPRKTDDEQVNRNLQAIAERLDQDERDALQLSDDDPQAVGTTSEGSDTRASRSDHVHAHGNQAGGTLHADASASSAGFMSAALYSEHTSLVAAEPGKQVLHGLYRTESTLSFATGTLTITPTVTAFNVWVDGEPFAKTTQTQGSFTDNTQTYVYFDVTGTIRTSASPWSLLSGNVPAATVYRNGSNYLVCDERHSPERDRVWHEWAHDTIGTRYESGLAGTFAINSLSITQGIIHDEDIELDTGGTKTDCALLYRASGATYITVELGATAPFKITAGVLQYDNAGTLTAVSSGQYVPSFVYATNDINYPIYVVVGQGQYATAALAASAPAPSVPGLATREWKLIYVVTARQVGGTATYVASHDYRTVNSLPGGATATPLASGVTTNTSAFSEPMTPADTNVQLALDALAHVGWDNRSHFGIRGHRLMGLTAPADAFFDEYTHGAGTGNIPFGYISTTGSGSTCYLLSGGYQSLLYAATGSGSGCTAFLQTTNAVYTLLASTPSAKRCYLATRMGTTQSVNSQTTIVTGLRDGGGNFRLQMGVIGSVSTSYFAILFGTATAITTVAIDTSEHTFEGYTLADGNLYVLIDGIAQTPLAYAGTAWTNGALGVHCSVSNGTTAAYRDAWQRFWLFEAER